MTGLTTATRNEPCAAGRNEMKTAEFGPAATEEGGSAPADLVSASSSGPPSTFVPISAALSVLPCPASHALGDTDLPIGSQAVHHMPLNRAAIVESGSARSGGAARASVMLQVIDRTRSIRPFNPQVRSSLLPISFSFTQSPGRGRGMRVTCCLPSNDGRLRMVFYLPCAFQVFRCSGVRVFRCSSRRRACRFRPEHPNT